MGIEAPSPEEFIELYTPTIRGLLATYEFFFDEEGEGPFDVNDNPDDRNPWLLDLNAGLGLDYDIADLDPLTYTYEMPGGDIRDPNAFIDHLLGSAHILYSQDLTTSSQVREWEPGEGPEGTVVGFDEFIGGPRPDDAPWYEEISIERGGDGTVPTVSAVGQFETDPRFDNGGDHFIWLFADTEEFDYSDFATSVSVANHQLIAIREGDATPNHTTIMADFSVQSLLLDHLVGEDNYDSEAISTDLAKSPFGALRSVMNYGILDPSELFTDADWGDIASGAALTGISGGLNLLNGFFGSFTGIDVFQRELPLLGLSIAEMVDFDAVFDHYVSTPLRDWLGENEEEGRLSDFVDFFASLQASAEDSGVQGFLGGTTSFGIDVSRVAGGFIGPSDLIAPILDPDDIYLQDELNEVRFLLPFEFEHNFNYTIVLPEIAHSFGIEFGQSIDLQFEVGIATDLEFGYDLREGLDANERFFIRNEGIEVYANASASGIDLPISLGLLEVLSKDGSIAFETAATFGINPFFNNNLGYVTRDTLFDIDETLINDFISFDRFDDPFSAFEFNLPFDLDRPGFPLIEDAVLSLSNSDAFSRAPTVEFFDFDGFEAITMLGAGGLDGIIRGLEVLLVQAENIPELRQNLPFLDGLNLEGIAQLSQSLREDLIDNFRDEDGVLQFTNLTEFVTRVANWLEMDPETLFADFIPAVELPDGSMEPAEYRFRFVFESAFDFAGEFQYQEDFGEIEIAAGSGQVTANGSAAFEIELGIKLDPQQIIAQAASALPVDGVLAETQTLSILLNGGNFTDGEAVDLILDPDDDFTGPEDIVAAINELILATPLAGMVVAELGEDDVLKIRTDFDGPYPSLLVNGADGLGFGSGLLESIDPLGSVTIEAFEGSVDLSMSAPELSAFGRIGFVQASFGDGDAAFDFNFTLDLLPEGEPISMRSFTSDLFSNPASAAPQILLSTAGGLALRDILVRRDFMEDPAVDAEIIVDFEITAEFPFEEGFSTADFDVQFEGEFNNILDFQGLEFEQILSLITDTLRVIETLSGSEFMDSEIPVINRSLNDLLDLADAFLELEEELEEEGPKHIQRVIQIIEDAVQDQLDRISGPSAITADVSIVYDEATQMLTFDIPYVVYLEETLAVELDALGAIEGLDRLADLRGSGTFEAEMTAFLWLEFAIDLSDPMEPELYVLDGTGVGLEAYLNSTDIEFDAAVGPLGIFIRNGSVTLRADEDASAPNNPIRNEFVVEDDRPHDPAFVYFGLDLGGESQIAITDMSGDDFAFSYSGVFEAEFPVFAPTETQPLEVDGVPEPPVSVVVNFDDITNPVIEGPDFSTAIQQNLADGLGVGLGLLFFALEEFATGEILGLPIPFVGDQLGSAANFLLDVREQIEAIFDDAVDYTESELRDLIFDALGPEDGLGILLPLMGTGLPDEEAQEVDAESDIRVEIEYDELSLEGIEIEMRLGQIIELLDGAIEFDLSLPGIDLTMNEFLQVNFSWAWHLTFGLNREDGFYLETQVDEDIEMAINVVLPPSGITGRLGFITFTADPRIPTDDSDTVLNGLELAGSVNLNPNGNGDQRLTIDSISNGSLTDLFEAELNGEAGLDWTMELGFASIDEGEPIDALPSFLVDLYLYWNFAEFTTNGNGGLLGDAPVFEINNPRLDVGTFFSDFLRPIVETIDGYLEPLRPVLNFVTQPISPLSFNPVAGLLGGSGGSVSILDIAVFLDVIDEEGAAFINAAATISDMIDMIANGSLPNRGSGVVIPLGGFDFSGLDMRNPGALSGASVNDPEESVEDAFADLGGDTAELYQMTQTLSEGSEEGGFEFDILDPQQLLNLISGEDATFFTYRFPELSFFFEFSRSFPVYSPPTIELLLGAGFGVQANIGFGYSSRGVQAFLAEDGSPSDLFGGFFVAVGEEEPPQLSLSGYFSGGASVGVPPLKGVAEIIIEARADFNLVDPEGGRLYFDQIAALIERDGLVNAITCLFFIEGDITGMLRLALELDLILTSKTLIEVDPVGPIELASFGSESDCFAYLLDDRLEDVEGGPLNNDTRATAADIGIAPGIHLTGTSISTFGDIDWYRFEILQNEEDMTITMEGEHPAFELSLYDEAGNLIDFVEGGTSRARIVTDLMLAGVYYIKVESADDSRIGDYTLNVTPSGERPGRIYYVNDPTVTNPSIHSFYTLAPGDDSHPQAGLSPNNPAESVQSILDNYGDQLTANDLILVDSGVYEDGFTLDAVAQSGLTIAGAPFTRYSFYGEDTSPDSVTVGSTFVGDSARIRIDGITGVTLYALRVEREASGAAFELSNVSDIKLLGVEANAADTGISVIDSEAVTLRGGKVEDMNVGVHIDNSDDVTIADMVFDGVPVLPPPPFEDMETDLTRSGSGVLVANNSSNVAINDIHGINLRTLIDLSQASNVAMQNLSSNGIDRGVYVVASNNVSIVNLSVEGRVTHYSFIEIPGRVNNMIEPIRDELVRQFFVYSMDLFDVDGFYQLGLELIEAAYDDGTLNLLEYWSHISDLESAVETIRDTEQVLVQSGRGLIGLYVEGSQSVNASQVEVQGTNRGFDVQESSQMSLNLVEVVLPTFASQAQSVDGFELRNSDIGLAQQETGGFASTDRALFIGALPTGSPSTDVELVGNRFRYNILVENTNGITLNDNDFRFEEANWRTVEFVAVDDLVMFDNQLGRLELTAVSNADIHSFNETGSVIISDSTVINFNNQNTIGRGASTLSIDNSTQIHFEQNSLAIGLAQLADSSEVSFVNNTISLGSVFEVRNSNDITFHNNNWTIGDQGIRLEAGEAGSTTDVVITDNNMQGGARGIHIVDEAVTQVEIRDNHLIGFSTAAMDFENGTALIVDNEVEQSAIGIRNSSMTIELRRNEIHHNDVGMEGSGMLGNDVRSADQHNWIYENETGVIVHSGALLAFNRIFENTGDGVLLIGSAALLRHNIIYRNDQASIRVRGGSGNAIHNNTVYSAGDYGIRLEDDAVDSDIKNNIVWSSDGYALSIEFGSDIGLSTDYNNWFTSDQGTLAFFQKPFDDLLDWRIESNWDLNSIGYTAVDPTLDQPQFVDFGNDDFRIVDLTATTINRGDPSFNFDYEPGPGAVANGLNINLGAYGDTTQAALSPEHYTNVIAPSFYTDYQRGIARLIIWEHFNISGTVDIELHREGEGFIELIDTVAHNNQPPQVTEQPDRQGSFFWSPQSSGIDADDLERYRIHIVPTDYSEAASSSREAFSVVESDGNFYVNDSSTSGTVYTNAAGDHRNSGLTPDSPKASLFALLQNYELGSGDTVYVDDGDYLHVRDLIVSSQAELGGNEAFTILGPAEGEGTAYFDRADTRSGTHHFRLIDADFVTIRNLTMENAHRGIVAEDSSNFFTLENLILRNQSSDQIRLSNDSERSNMANLTLENGGGYGIRTSDRVETLTDSHIRNHSAWGVYLTSPGNLLMTGNVIEGNSSGGLYINNNVSSTTAVVGSETFEAGEGNRIFNNSSSGVQVDMRNNVLLVGNAIYRSGSGSGEGRGIEARSGEVRGNVIFGHGIGIYSFFSNTIAENRLYDNADYGMFLNGSSAESIYRNVVYDSDIGIYSNSNSANTYRNNLVYNTTSYGIYHRQGNNAVFENNTISVSSGDALRLRDATNATLRNNILQVNNGTAILLDTNSQPGFDSDFNLFHRLGDGAVGQWAEVARSTFSDWRNASFEDANSLMADPLFVDPASGDFHLQSEFGWYENGELAPVLDPVSGTPIFPEATLQTSGDQSPGIDRGDDASDFSNEPAPNGNFINMGAYGNTTYASLSPDEYVLITRPQVEVTWPMLQSFDIRWRSHDFSGTVTIRLLREGQSEPVKVIAEDVANSGTYRWELPDDLTEADDYWIEVERGDDVSLVAQSLTTFAIVDPIFEYFVNNDTVIDGGFTFKPGDNANDGLSRDTPMASIRAVLEAYNLGENDIIYVDSGTYDVTTNILLTTEDSGVTIEGFYDPSLPDERTVLDRGNISNSSYLFELDGVSDLTLRHLTITGAYYGIYADDNGAEDIYIENSRFIANREGGIRIENGSPGLYVSDSEFIGDGTTNGDGRQRYGIWYQSGLMEVTGSYFENNSDRGIRVTGVPSAEIESYLIENNEITGSLYQIEVSAREAVIRGNELYDSRGNNGRGVSVNTSVALVEDNIVYAHGGYGIYVAGGATAEGNTVYGSDVGIWTSESVARGNTVYDNADGIRTTGSALVEFNEVFNNDRGINADSSSATIRHNAVYDNQLGIYGGPRTSIGQFTGVIDNNRLYSNADGAIHLENSTLGSRDLRNNTIVQEGGFGIRLTNADNTTVENNIIVMSANGIAIEVDSTSVNDTTFNYNLYDLRGEATHFAEWGGRSIDNLPDWYFEIGQGFNSLFADPMFVDESEFDFTLMSNSPAIAAGNPDSAWAGEPLPAGGRINLGAFGNTANATIADDPLITFLSVSELLKLEQGTGFTGEFVASGFRDSLSALWLNVNGNVGRWQSLVPDDGFSRNRTSNPVDLSNVVDPAPAAVYETQYETAAGIGSDMTFRWWNAAGNYNLRLHFMDPGLSADYEFDVVINGETVIEGLNVETAAGGAYVAHIETLDLELLSSGIVELTIVNQSSGRGILSAIEIVRPADEGVADPRFMVEATLDDGATWETVATDIEIDNRGIGSFTWTPAASTVAADARFRITSIEGPSYTTESDSFVVANDGNVYFVNDDSLDDVQFVSAIGDNLNSGKDPSSPMRSLEALLNAYDLSSGDTVYIDSGTYQLSGNIVLSAAQSGLTIIGADDPEEDIIRTILNRNGTGSNDYALELQGAESLTLQNFTLTGARTGIYANNAQAPYLTLDGMTLVNNDWYGVDIDRDNPGLTVTNSRFYTDSSFSDISQRFGLEYSATGGSAVITDNTFYNLDDRGLQISGSNSLLPGTLIITDNLADSVTRGITMTASGALIENNIVRNNSQHGIEASGGNTLVRFNTIEDNVGSGHGSTQGIILQSGAIGEYNTVSGSINPAQGVGIGISVGSGSTARYNTISDSDEGIRISTGAPNPQIIENILFDNLIGINAAASRGIISGNEIRSNELGILGGPTGPTGQFTGVIENNFILHNTDGAIRFFDSTNGDADVRNNTILQMDGFGIRLENAPDTFVYNNIFVMEGGRAIEVDDNSVVNTRFNYNLYDLREGAQFATWAVLEVETLADWFYEVGQGFNSIFADPLFVDEAADDFRLQASSPAVAAGDPDQLWLIEPVPAGGRVNLGAFGGTGEATAANEPLIDFLNLNGLSKLELGMPYTIDFLAAGFIDRETFLFNVGSSEVEDWRRLDPLSGNTSTTNNSIDLSSLIDPAPEAVYQSSYVSPNGVGEQLEFMLGLGAGNYTIRLHFAQLFSGNETMDIFLDGDKVLESFSPYEEAGETIRKGVIVDLDLELAESQSVALDLVTVEQRSRLNAIEVIRHRDEGVAEPTFVAEASFDDGSTWEVIADDIAIDRFQRGTLEWTPDEATDGRSALVRLSSTHGPEAASVSESFLVANDGNTYYVNNTVLEDLVHTTAAGNNLNSGKSPDAPMASLTALLNAYTPGEGDIIYIDSGRYILTNNTVLSSVHSGLTIVGANNSPLNPDARTILDRDNTSHGSIAFELLETDGITFRNFEIVNARTGIEAGRQEAHNLRVEGMTFRNNDQYGMDIDHNLNLTVVDSWFGSDEEGSQRFGLQYAAGNEIDGPGVFTGNTFMNHSTRGMGIVGASSAQTGDYLISGNTFYNNSTGLEANRGALVENNVAYGNQLHGLNVTGSTSLVRENIAYDNNSGNSSRGIRISDGIAENNVVYNNTRGIEMSGSATVRNNIIFENEYGIWGSSGLIEGNRIFGNTDYGIYVRNNSPTIVSNQVYSNQIGMQLGRDSGAGRFSGVVENNIIYDNNEFSIRVLRAGNSDFRIVNNTIYHPVGRALDLSNLVDGRIANNIVVIEAGFVFTVDSDSQGEFTSERNLFYLGTDPNARFGEWGGVTIDTLSEWQSLTSLESNSPDADPLFFDISGADDVFGYREVDGVIVDGGEDDNFQILGGSPAIDAGVTWWAPQTDFAGSERRSDPGTSNTGGARYVVTDLGESLFDGDRGAPLDISNSWGGSGSTGETIDLPFDFPFYEQVYDSIYVAGSGLMQFATSTSTRNFALSDFIEDPNIAAMWENIDLRYDSESDIYYDDSVEGEVYFRWEGRSIDHSDVVRFAVLLSEDGSIRFDYGEAPANDLVDPIVGISYGNEIDFTLIDGPFDGATSVTFSFAAGVTDIGAFEFQGDSDDDSPPVTLQTNPPEIEAGGMADPPLSNFSIAFSEAIEFIGANSPATYELILDSTGAGSFTSSDTTFELVPSYNPATFEVDLVVADSDDLADGSLPEGDYRLTVFSSSLRDVSGNQLDGNGDGEAGGDYVRFFSVGEIIQPEAGFEVSPVTGNTATEFTFDASSSSHPAGMIESYFWDFGDDNNTEGEIVTHTFVTSGTFTVTLTVTDSNGFTDSTTIEVEVSNQLPVAIIEEIPPAVEPDTLITFDARSSFDPDGFIVLFEWDFGDGESATGDVVSHTFTDEGQYTVTLTVTDNEGAQDTTSVVVQISPEDLDPEIVDWMINEGASQRSMVSQIDIVFNTDVGGSIMDASIQLFEQVEGVFVADDLIERSWDATAYTLTLTFPQATGASLSDGVYTLLVDGETITAANEMQLDGNADGEEGGLFIAEFHRYFGDYTGTGAVSVLDALLFRQALDSSVGDAAYDPAFDASASGQVDADDLAVLEANLGTTILTQAAFSHDAPPARQITAIVVNDDEVQRSRVETLAVSFDYALEGVVTVDDLRLFNRSTGDRIDPATVDLTWSEDGRTAIMRFDALDNGTLADGLYSLVVDGDSILFQGIALDANADGNAGGVYRYDFHRLFGDSTGTESVSILDAMRFNQALGTNEGDEAYRHYFDDNASGSIGAVDQAAFEANLGLALDWESTTPLILREPAPSTTASIGDSITLAVSVESTSPAFFTWYLDDEEIASGEWLDSITLDDLGADDFGNYRVEITNAFGMVTSQLAELLQAGG